MTKEEMKEFSLRIAESSKTELVVITYDVILNYVESAVKAHKDNELDLVVFNLQKAKQFVNICRHALILNMKFLTNLCVCIYT